MLKLLTCNVTCIEKKFICFFLILKEVKDEQWKKAMDFLSTTPELNYMTQINIMMFEDPSKVTSYNSSSKSYNNNIYATIKGWGEMLKFRRWNFNGSTQAPTWLLTFSPIQQSCSRRHLDKSWLFTLLKEMNIGKVGKLQQT